MSSPLSTTHKDRFFDQYTTEQLRLLVVNYKAMVYIPNAQAIASAGEREIARRLARGVEVDSYVLSKFNKLKDN